MLTPSRLLHRFGCAVLLLASALLTLSCSKQPSSDDAITVYSARAEHLISPLFDRYTQETGIEIRYITDNADRKSTRLNSSHVAISYAVFCLKKKSTKYSTVQLQTQRGTMH